MYSQKLYALALIFERRACSACHPSRLAYSGSLEIEKRLVCLSLEDKKRLPVGWSHLPVTRSCAPVKRAPEPTQTFHNLTPPLRLRAKHTYGSTSSSRGAWMTTPQSRYRREKSHLPFDYCGPERTMFQLSTFMCAQNCSPAAETVASPKVPSSLFAL